MQHIEVKQHQISLMWRIYAGNLGKVPAGCRQTNQEEKAEAGNNLCVCQSVHARARTLYVFEHMFKRKLRNVQKKDRYLQKETNLR